MEINLIAPELHDVALGKRAKQSSIGEWSYGEDVEADAVRLIDGGARDRDYSNHTSAEARPWWQVDLGEQYIVDHVLIANRLAFPDRLGTITLHGSNDGERWWPIGRSVAGSSVDLTVPISSKMPITHLRIRKEQHGFLHLRGVAILGRLPNSEETAAFRVIGEQQDRIRAQALTAFTIGRSGRSITAGNFTVFADEDRYSAGVIEHMQNGEYERQERATLPYAIKPGDRVVEIGTAVGIVTMTAASIIGAENIATFEANPYILSDARRNFAVNDFQDIQSTNAILCARSRLDAIGKTMAFGISREFVCSRIGATLQDSDIIEVYHVPTMCLEEVIDTFGANVLICDIEGGEVDLLCNADLSRIDTLLLETHYQVAGRDNISGLIRNLILSGFDLDLDHCEGHVSLFRRGSRPNGNGN